MVTANKLNTLIAGPTTPAVIQKKITTKPALTMQPLRTPSKGTNAQTEQMQKALDKTKKVQKTYGVPGAK